MTTNNKSQSSKAKKNGALIAVLPGDGVGVEVTAEAERALRAVGQRFGSSFEISYGLVGGAAMEQTGEPLPKDTLELCHRADAVLFGAVGDPRFDDPKAKKRPEQGLMDLRKGLALFANLRPVQVFPTLAEASPVRADLVQGVDLLVVRELTGGIYFGKPREEGTEQAIDTMTYTRQEVERIAHVAFRLAKKRRSRVTSVDKANVLACSRLWRQTVDQVALSYPEVELEHLLVDAMTMHLIQRPRDFDVVLTANLFGDILSDETSVLTGSMGMLASASLAEGQFGLYEPVHGSATDIAGQGIANPVAAVLCVVMMLRYSLGLEQEARALETAVTSTLEAGFRTADITNEGQTAVTTRQMGDQILAALENPQVATATEGP